MLADLPCNAVVKIHQRQINYFFIGLRSNMLIINLSGFVSTVLALWYKLLYVIYNVNALTT